MQQFSIGVLGHRSFQPSLVFRRDPTGLNNEVSHHEKEALIAVAAASDATCYYAVDDVNNVGKTGWRVPATVVLFYRASKRSRNDQPRISSPRRRDRRLILGRLRRRQLTSGASDKPTPASRYGSIDRSLMHRTSRCSFLVAQGRARIFGPWLCGGGAAFLSLRARKRSKIERAVWPNIRWPAACRRIVRQITSCCLSVRRL